ncbi:MAG TPA: winged helix-turn-helix domain-containing protein [Gammaproteobacteria bacterium]|nr:winged helix-turn-helix domain-containing protein [Gammaproteobacteria bacterium]
MLQAVDCVILCKLMAQKENDMTHRDLAEKLFLSRATISVGLKRLLQSGLVRSEVETNRLLPVMATAEEFIFHGLKYVFPAEVGKFTKGVATGIAAPVFEGKLVLGNDPIFVWPYEHGKVKGLALKPLSPSVPKAVASSEDRKFYDLLALVDAIRQGRARERNVAVELFKEVIKS